MNKKQVTIITMAAISLLQILGACIVLPLAHGAELGGKTPWTKVQITPPKAIAKNTNRKCVIPTSREIGTNPVPVLVFNSGTSRKQIRYLLDRAKEFGIKMPIYLDDYGTKSENYKNIWTNTVVNREYHYAISINKLRYLDRLFRPGAPPFVGQGCGGDGCMREAALMSAIDKKRLEFGLKASGLIGDGTTDNIRLRRLAGEHNEIFTSILAAPGQNENVTICTRTYNMRGRHLVVNMYFYDAGARFDCFFQDGNIGVDDNILSSICLLQGIGLLDSPASFATYLEIDSRKGDVDLSSASVTLLKKLWNAH